MKKKTAKKLKKDFYIEIGRISALISMTQFELGEDQEVYQMISDRIEQSTEKISAILSTEVFGKIKSRKFEKALEEMREQLDVDVDFDDEDIHEIPMGHS